MPRYFYSGSVLTGETVEGSLRARNESELESSLVSRGIALTSCRPAIGLLQRLRISLFARSEITRITRQIHILLESGITAREALMLALDQLKDSTLRQVFAAIIKSVESGESLADAMRAYPTVFDELYVSMISAGELSGDLDRAFDRVATYREKYEAITRKIRSALAYPLLVVLVAVLVVSVLVFYVVPIFSSMYENFGAELPQLTARVIDIATFVRDHITLGLVLLVILLGAGAAAIRTHRVRLLLHRLAVTLPGIRPLMSRVLAARFCRTLGALLTSGVEIVYALRIATRTTGNLYAQTRIEPAEARLTQGDSLTDSLQEVGLFPAAMLRMSASGEKTGRLGEMLVRAADYYDRETDTAIGTLTSLIEPLVIMFLGVLIAFILVAMYLPLFDLVGAL